MADTTSLLKRKIFCLAHKANKREPILLIDYLPTLNKKKVMKVTYVGAFFKKLSFEGLSKEVSVIWYFLMYFLSQIPSEKPYID